MRTVGGRALIYSVILLALALAAGACGKGGRGRGQGGGGGTVAAPAAVVPVVEAARPKLPPLPARELPPEWRAARERAMADASRLRGLPWLSDVGMTPLSSLEYGARTSEVAAEVGGEDLRALSRLAVAGGILPEGTDLAALTANFTALSAGAAYSPPDRQVLLLYGDTKRAVPKGHPLLAHEFVHALQDQHFDLLGLLLARPYNFDRTEAAFALVEGDATDVQRRLEAGDAFARRTVEEIARAEDARFDPYRRGVGWLFPPLITETFIFRYRDGLRFVETMRRRRPAITPDELFRRPPASTEQVLHPEKYLSQEPPRAVLIDDVTLTRDGWRAASSTTLGELGVRGLLLAGVVRQEAVRAAAGWGGDRASVFEREGRAPLFVWQTAWDTAADAREFFDAYNALRQQTAAPAATSDAREAAWREGSALTLVRVEGDAVLVVRGAAEDVPAAAAALLR
jgi:hypothetical protein